MKGTPMNHPDAFRALGLSPSTLAALRAKGFETPTPIQALTIPKLLEGRVDLIGQAQTGTGKTAAFGIPILELAVPGADRPQALVLAPTRELCMQIAAELRSLRGERSVRIAPVYGGQAIEVQLRRLKEGVDIVVGTPGRVIDLIQRGSLDLSGIAFAVLDEADEMLDMGFIEEIETILTGTPSGKRTLMFSATMPPEIMKIAERFMRDFEVVRTPGAGEGIGLTEQVYYELRREEKLEALARILEIEEDIYALVFCRTRNDVDELVEKLKLRGLRVEALHGDIMQMQRTRVINQFKEKQFRVLIATDVAARGIDVSDLTHVINYSMPRNAETYIHRIGRTGRAGRSGRAVTFVTPAESRRLAEIAREAGVEIRRGELPQGRAMVEAGERRFAEQVSEVLRAERHCDYLPFAERLARSAASPVDVLAAVLQLRFRGELLERNYDVIGAGRPQRSRGENVRSRGRVRLCFATGKADHCTVAGLLDLIRRRTGSPTLRIGRIECGDHAAIVNVDAATAETVLAAFRGDPLRVHPVAESSGGQGAASPVRDRTRRAPKTPVRAGEEGAASPVRDRTRRTPKTPAAGKKERLTDWVGRIAAEFEEPRARTRRKSRP